MALYSLHRHRLPLLLPLLLATVLSATCRGDPSGDDYKYNTSICKLQPYTCGEVDIHYPFYLSNQTADILGSSSSSCGYPGLAIDCVDDEYPILYLGSSPDASYSYNVTGIDYTSSTIYLGDPDVLEDLSCPRVDHNVTVPSSSWLNLSDDYLLFFANCSEAILPGQPNIKRITCPSYGLDGNSFVIPLEVPHQLLQQQCSPVIQVPVLQNASLEIDQQWSVNGYRNALIQGFQLEWNSSLRSDRCTQCEGSDGRCAYSGVGEFVGCLCTNGRVSDHECAKGKPFVSCSSTFSTSLFFFV